MCRAACGERSSSVRCNMRHCSVAAARPRFPLVNWHYDTAFDVGIYVNRRMLHCNKPAQSSIQGAASARSDGQQPLLNRGVACLRKSLGKSALGSSYSDPPRPPRRRGHLVGHGDAAAIGARRRAADRGGEYDRPCGHRHRGYRRHLAFRHRHHGDQRNRFGRGREARDRADQCARRRARPQDQVHPGRWSERLADLRREGKEAPGPGQVRIGDGLLDLGFAQGGIAGVRAIQRHALLPHLL